MNNFRAAAQTLEFKKVLALVANHAATFLAKKKVQELSPSSDFAQVKKLLEQTDQALTLLNTSQNPPFGGFSDVSEEVKKAMLGGSLQPQELRMIGNLLYCIKRLKDFFEHSADDYPLLTEYTLNLTVLDKLQKQIDSTVSPQFTIFDNASVQLQTIRRQIGQNQIKVKQKLESILHSTEYKSYFQDQLVTLRADRYVIPIKQEYRQFFPGIVHDQSGSGATVFIEPLSVVEINNDIKRFLAQEKEEVERILKNLSGLVGTNGNYILNSMSAVVELDVIFSKAHFALEFDGAFPILAEDDNINIINARHPLIDKHLVVPINVQVGGDVKVLVITGSNAGGKTVTLKIIGLFSLLCQTGLFLPASSGTTMPIFTDVYADIGDEQSIEKSLSTFSSQISNLVKIVDAAKKNSLVLLDEICVGTDPKEGAALSMAILQKLKDNEVTTVVTTHYSELKVFALEQDKMQNASVEFDQATLKPTYRLLMGMPGSSNAFHIAKRLGLNSDVVTMAESYLDSDYKKLEDVIDELENQRKEYQEKTVQIEQMHQDTRLLQQRIAQREQQVANKKSEILEKSKKEAEQIVRQARIEATEAIKELKALHNVSDSKLRQQAIDNVRAKLQPKLVDVSKQIIGEFLTKEKAKIGNSVYIPTLSQKGVILSANYSDVTLQIGALKTNLPFKKCTLIEQEKKKEQIVAFTSSINQIAHTADFKNQIDVRGKTIDEAIVDIDKYLDDAVLAGVQQVRIIHGKGTGALRRGLVSYFSNHNLVKSFEIAGMQEGGLGATIVFL